jgi:hypothetical protein
MNIELKSEYESLLLKREQYEKEAGVYLTLYIHEFGELITDVYKAKIDCIELKKSIAYCQKCANHGKTINRGELNKYIKTHMSSYYEELQKMIDDNKACKKLKASSEIDAQKSKRIYRKIAKLLHPDINPLTNKNDELMDLWQQAMKAYHTNDAKMLEEVEVLVNLALEKAGFDIEQVDIPNLGEKIDNLENEIHSIISTDPYQYKYLLDDTDAVEDKKNELNAELKEYERYKDELTKVLEGFKIDEEVPYWQMN